VDISAVSPGTVTRRRSLTHALPDARQPAYHVPRSGQDRQSAGTTTPSHPATRAPPAVSCERRRRATGDPGPNTSPAPCGSIAALLRVCPDGGSSLPSCATSRRWDEAPVHDNPLLRRRTRCRCTRLVWRAHSAREDKAVGVFGGRHVTPRLEYTRALQPEASVPRSGFSCPPDSSRQSFFDDPSSFLLLHREVLEPIEAAAAGGDEVHVAVAVEIHGLGV